MDDVTWKRRHLILGLLTLLSYTVNGEIEIKIASEPVQRVALGINHVVTCEIIGVDHSQITEFRWLDPRNMTVNEKSAYNSENQPKITVLRQHGQSRLLLRFMPMNEGDAGVYTCVGKTASETLVKTVTIKTYMPITWVDAPEEQSTLRGSQYKVRCKVVANPAPTVDWERTVNDAIKPIMTDSHMVVETDGLLINDIQIDDDGVYTCRAIVDSTGSYSERRIKLEVLDVPSFREDVVKFHEITEGEEAIVTCPANGKPPPMVTWIRTATQENITTNMDGVLRLPRVTKMDNGTFNCVATNKAGTTTLPILFNVLSKPEIVEIRNGTAIEKGRGELQCYATGNPTPQIIFEKFDRNEWKKLDASVDARTADNIKRDANTNEVVDRIREVKGMDRNRQNTVYTTLHFQQVTRNDDGLYRCVARNSIGEQIKNAHLSVEFAPSFERTTVINSVPTWNDQPVNLTCLAESIPNATISWYYKNTLVDRDETNRGEPTLVKYGNGPLSSLEIRPRGELFYGDYKCCAKNIHGEACHDIKLWKAFAPDELRGAKAEVITATTITFVIPETLNNGGLPIEGYFCNYKMQYEDWRDAKNATWPARSTFILENLQPRVIYNFRFAAFNKAGLGRWGESIQVEMPQRSTPSVPAINNALQNGLTYSLSPYARQIELTWKMPADNGENIDEYEIKYCQIDKIDSNGNVFEDGSDKCVVRKLLYSVGTSYKIIDLMPDTFYRVELRAHNAIGYSVTSQQYFKTNTGDADAEAASRRELKIAVIVYIAVAILIALLVIVDIFCFFVANAGLLHLLCGVCCGRNKKTEDKLGSEAKDLISNGNGKKVAAEHSPMINDKVKKDTTVEYDVKKGVSKTAFVGKDSAV